MSREKVFDRFGQLRSNAPRDDVIDGVCAWLTTEPTNVGLLEHPKAHRLEGASRSAEVGIGH
jgi:hypothetical protein